MGRPVLTRLLGVISVGRGRQRLLPNICHLSDGYVMPRVSARRATLCLLPLLMVVLVLCFWRDSQTVQEYISTTAGPVHPPTTDLPTQVEAVTTGSGGRPWYMSGGKGGYSPARGKLFPGERPESDGIEDQLLYAPETVGTKVVLLYNGLGSWTPIKPGKSSFATCPVKDCSLTMSKGEAAKVDAILFKDHFSNPDIVRPRNQVWILYMLECPYHTQHMKYNDVFNWTATYRRDSDLVAPYEKWVYFNKSVTTLPVSRNYAANKTKQVAWFVSNCGARNSRLQYAHELQKHISVDIFGACGSKKCPRSKQDKCFEMLDSDYKFYLAFENSNCRDYITEKFFVNGLGRDVIPVAMGARPEDYARSAPEKSYIHVDQFDSPKALAEYLHLLDKDDDLYNSYFRWKGTGEFINTHFFCRLCALLHDKFPAKSYRNINEWWRGPPGVCTSSSWRKQNPNWYTSLTRRLSW